MSCIRNTIPRKLDLSSLVNMLLMSRLSNSLSGRKMLVSVSGRLQVLYVGPIAIAAADFSNYLRCLVTSFILFYA